MSEEMLTLAAQVAPIVSEAAKSEVEKQMLSMGLNDIQIDMALYTKQNNEKFEQLQDTLAKMSKNKSSSKVTTLEEAKAAGLKFCMDASDILTANTTNDITRVKFAEFASQHDLLLQAHDFINNEVYVHNELLDKNILAQQREFEKAVDIRNPLTFASLDTLSPLAVAIGKIVDIDTKTSFEEEVSFMQKLIADNTGSLGSFTANFGAEINAPFSFNKLKTSFIAQTEASGFQTMQEAKLRCNDYTSSVMQKLYLQYMVGGVIYDNDMLASAKRQFLGRFFTLMSDRKSGVKNAFAHYLLTCGDGNSIFNSLEGAEGSMYNFMPYKRERLFNATSGMYEISTNFTRDNAFEITRNDLYTFQAIQKEALKNDNAVKRKRPVIKNGNTTSIDIDLLSDIVAKMNNGVTPFVAMNPAVFREYRTAVRAAEKSTTNATQILSDKPYDINFVEGVPAKFILCEEMPTKAIGNPLYTVMTPAGLVKPLLTGTKIVDAFTSNMTSIKVFAGFNAGASVVQDPLKQITCEFSA